MAILADGTSSGATSGEDVEHPNLDDHRHDQQAGEEAQAAGDEIDEAHLGVAHRGRLGRRRRKAFGYNRRRIRGR